MSGDTTSMLQLSNYYKEDLARSRYRDRVAQYWLRKAAEGGSHTAPIRLYQMYCDDLEVQPNFEAFGHFLRFV